MKHTSTFWGILGLLASLAGCSDPDATVAEGEDFTDSIEQPAEWDTYTVFPLVDVGAGTVMVHGDSLPVNVQVRYLGDKTTLTGHTIMAPALITTLGLTAYETETHAINLGHAAFTGGYGAIQLQNASGANLWQSHVIVGKAVFDTSGNVYSNGIYKIPYHTGVTNVVLAVTNLLTTPVTFTFFNLAPALNTLNVSIHGLSTFRFDAAALGWTLTTPGSIRVDVSGATFAISGYLQKAANKYHFWPTTILPS